MFTNSHSTSTASRPVHATWGNIFVAVVLAFAAPTLAWSAPSDYRFEVTAPVKTGPDAAIVLRLLHIPSSKPVQDAIIFKSQLEMVMAGHPPAPVQAGMPKPSGAGLYTLRAPVSMAGEWTLRLSAKVQGEKDTVTGAVTFTSVQ